MMWLIQFAVAWAMRPETINAVFALLCLAAAMGANARWVAVISAVLYALLVMT